MFNIAGYYIVDEKVKTHRIDFNFLNAYWKGNKYVPKIMRVEPSNRTDTTFLCLIATKNINKYR